MVRWGKGNLAEAGELVTESRAVGRAGAREVRVEVRLGAGELVIAGGAGDLLEATFSYNVPSWRPEVGYEVRDGQGLLTIRQPEGDAGPAPRDARQRWELRLAGGIPLALAIRAGAVTGALTAGALTLTDLEIEAGTSNLGLDLAGARGPLDARLRGGVVNGEVRLPAAVGARVAVQSPIVTVNAAGFRRAGSVYTNEAAGVAAPPLRLAIKAGVASLTLTAVAAAP